MTHGLAMNSSAESRTSVHIVSANRLFADAVANLLGRDERLRVAVGVPGADGAEADVLLVDATVDAAGALDRLRGLLPPAPPAPAGAPAASAAPAGPGVPGPPTAAEARRCTAIVLGLASEDEQLVAFIEAGARGYVLQGAAPEDLPAAIHAARRGACNCSPRLAGLVAARILELERSLPAPAARRPCEPLTRREREVIAWMATGRSNKEIGSRLGISVQTVKNHVHSLLAKLGAGRRREALRIAYESGLLGEWGDETLLAAVSPASPVPRATLAAPPAEVSPEPN
jgi:DNA-binding NarL/FixJ family response regulator